MQQLERWIWRLVDLLIMAAIIGMVIIISLQVGSRLVAGSLVWTEELSRFLFIWTIWLGMAAGFRHGLHPSLDLFTARLPALSGLFKWIQVLACSVFLAVVAWHGQLLVQQQIRFGEVSAILQIGKWLTSVPIVLGSTLAILGVITNALMTPPVDTTQEVKEGLS